MRMLPVGVVGVHGLPGAEEDVSFSVPAVAADESRMLPKALVLGFLVRRSMRSD
jgi:hypothetical protein